MAPGRTETSKGVFCWRYYSHIWGKMFSGILFFHNFMTLRADKSKSKTQTLKLLQLLSDVTILNERVQV